MTIDTERLRELAAELGFWPATTDEADIERHRQHNKNADYVHFVQSDSPAPRAVVIAHQAHRVPRSRLYVDRCERSTVIRSGCSAPLSGVVIDGGRRPGRVV